MSEDKDQSEDVASEEVTSSCPHYKRRCAFISPCCAKEYPCRLCHDNEETHVLDRFSVQEIKCTQCQTKQQVRKDCVKCGTIFGEYFCSICRLYDDNPKQQFHCDGCGLCRVGGRENFFHCERCDMCLGVNLKDKHKCVEKVSRANCPVCMEDLHTSTSSLHVPKCQHMIHSECYVQLLKSGNFTCPTCNVSLEKMEEYWRALDNEIANTPMPEEYRDKKVGVLCRDCHKESETNFHIIGLKCQHCGSYNTCGSDIAVAAGDAPTDRQSEPTDVADESWEQIDEEDVEEEDEETNGEDSMQSDMPLD